MSGKKKRRLIALGLAIGLSTSLSVYFGLFADRGTPPSDVNTIYSLTVRQGERIVVRYIAAADFTGDEVVDILVSYDLFSYGAAATEGGSNITLSFREAELVILSSNTTGDFQKSWEYDSGLTRQAADTGDFNGDGRPDIVIGGFKVKSADIFPPSGTSTTEVLLNEGHGTFYDVLSSHIPAFYGPTAVVAGDFDGDGGADFVTGGLAVESDSPYGVYLFHNVGRGNFAISQIALRKGIVVQSMWKAAIDNDGSPDLVIQATDLSTSTNSVILLLNDGRGGFGFQELTVSATSMIIGDFAGDGYPDIIYVGSGQSGDRVCFLPNVKGEFAEPQPVAVASEGQIAGMAYADFNNDGTLDLVLLENRAELGQGELELNTMEHLISITEGPDGELCFTPRSSRRLLVGEHISPGGITAADINNDLRLDLVLVSGEGQVYLVLNAGD